MTDRSPARGSNSRPPRAPASRPPLLSPSDREGMRPPPLLSSGEKYKRALAFYWYSSDGRTDEGRPLSQSDRARLPTRPRLPLHVTSGGAALHERQHALRGPSALCTSASTHDPPPPLCTSGGRHANERRTSRFEFGGNISPPRSGHPPRRWIETSPLLSPSE